MSDKNGSHVTARELNDKLDKFRWEVRFLILAGMMGSQLIPVGEVARAALNIF